MGGSRIRKGQITIFIILGIMIFFSFLLITSLHNDSPDASLEIGKLESINNNMVIVKEYIDKCIEDSTYQTIKDNGLNNEVRLENYFNSHIEACIDHLNPLKMSGIMVEEKALLVSDFNISDTGNSIRIHVDYPIAIDGSGMHNYIEDFYTDYDLYNELELSFDSSGKIKEDQTLSLKRPSIKLRIQKGTTANMSDGSPIEKISIRIADKESYEHPYTALIGNRVFALEPARATFNPPIEIEYDYDDDFYSWIEEDKIGLSYYREKPMADPSVKWNKHRTISLDTKKNRIIANISYFGPIALTAEKTSILDLSDNKSDYICTKIMGSGSTKGFMALETFNEDLYAGAYLEDMAGNTNMIFSLKEKGQMDPGIKDVKESVQDLLVFKGKLYANTQDGYDSNVNARIYRTENGKDWEIVYDTAQKNSSGHGLAEFQNNLYAGYNGIVKRSHSGDKGTWEEVLGLPNHNITTITAYNHNIYAFSTSGSGKDAKGFMSYSLTGEPNSWTTEPLNNILPAKAYGWNGSLWISSARMADSNLNLAPNAKPGIFRYNGSGIKKSYDGNDTNSNYMGGLIGFNGQLFAGTGKGWKLQNAPTSLIFTKDGGESWRRACVINETLITDLETIDGTLYVSTWDNTKGGALYEVIKRNKTDLGPPESCHGENEHYSRFNPTGWAKDNTPTGVFMTCADSPFFEYCEAKKPNDEIVHLKQHGFFGLIMLERDRQMFTKWLEPATTWGSPLRITCYTPDGDGYKYVLTNNENTFMYTTPESLCPKCCPGSNSWCCPGHETEDC